MVFFQVYTGFWTIPSVHCLSFQGLEVSGEEFPPVTGLARSNCFQTFRRPKSSWRTLAGMGPKGPKMTPKSSRLIRLISVNWLETGRDFPMKQWNQDAEKDLEQKNQELTASSQAHWGFFWFWTVPVLWFFYVFLNFYVFLRDPFLDVTVDDEGPAWNL